MAAVQEGEGFPESVFNSQKHLSWGGVGRLTILPRGVRAGESGKDLVPRNEAVAPGRQQLKAGHAAMAKAVRAPPARAANKVAGPLPRARRIRCLCTCTIYVLTRYTHKYLIYKK